MNIRNKKNKSSKKVIITLVLLLLVIGAGVGAYIILNQNDSNSAQEDKKQENEKNKSNTGEETRDSGNASTDSSVEHESEKEITPGYEGENPNLNDSLTGSINYTGVAGNNLIIRTTINQTLSSGSCEISLTNGSTTVTRTSGIIPNPSSSSCEGFDIPTSELGSGNWEITIKITSGDKSGVLKGTAKI